MNSFLALSDPDEMGKLQGMFLPIFLLKKVTAKET